MVCWLKNGYFGLLGLLVSVFFLLFFPEQTHVTGKTWHNRRKMWLHWG